MQKLFIKLLWTLNLAVAISLLAAFLSPLINPKQVSLFAFFGLSYPILLYLNLAFVVFWLFAKRKFAILSLLLVLAGYPLLHRYVQVFPVTTGAADKGLKVMSYNVRSFHQLGRKNSNSTKTAIVNLVERQNPDIVCFQEFGKAKNNVNGFKLDMPLYGQGENIIYTRLKVVKQGIVISREDKKFGIYVDVLFNSDTVRVFNVQLLSYSVSNELELYDKKEHVNRKRFIFSIAAKLNSGFTRRVHETEVLTHVISRSPHAVIVCGDFNDPPASYTYQKVMSNKLKDAFIESGSGLGITYSWTFPKVRIDYILTSPEFELYNYHVIKSDLSDHFPVTAYVVK